MIYINNKKSIDPSKDIYLSYFNENLKTLYVEESEVYSLDIKASSKGRTKEEINQKIVIFLQKEIQHIKRYYSDNITGIKWINNNLFSIYLRK
jgi:hypothetical protein